MLPSKQDNSTGSNRFHLHCATMKFIHGFKFLFFGILVTIVNDISVSTSSWFLISLACMRLIAMTIALGYQMIFNYYEKHTKQETFGTFWKSLKQVFLILAAVQHSFVWYHLQVPGTFWSGFSILAQLFVPIMVYLWICRIQNEDLSYLQEVCLGTDCSTPMSSNTACRCKSISTCRKMTWFLAHSSPLKRLNESTALRRLLRYSRADVETLVFGSLLLLGAAVCKFCC